MNLNEVAIESSTSSSGDPRPFASYVSRITILKQNVFPFQEVYFYNYVFFNIALIIDLREIGWDGTDWIVLAQDRDQWKVLVNMVMNVWIP
jgi:hypothetical protein